MASIALVVLMVRGAGDDSTHEPPERRPDVVRVVIVDGYRYTVFCDDGRLFYGTSHGVEHIVDDTSCQH